VTSFRLSILDFGVEVEGLNFWWMNPQILGVQGIRSPPSPPAGCPACSIDRSGPRFHQSDNSPPYRRPPFGPSQNFFHSLFPYSPNIINPSQRRSAMTLQSQKAILSSFIEGAPPGEVRRQFPAPSCPILGLQGRMAYLRLGPKTNKPLSSRMSSQARLLAQELSCPQPFVISSPTHGAPDLTNC